jgi:prepilin-type processing-associated H-X9-DG protein
MSRIVIIGLILLAIFIGLGLVLPAIFRARTEEEFRRCQNHLRQIGAFGMFHSAKPGEPMPKEAQTYFPSGTLVNADLKPDRRMSWYVLVLGAIDYGEPGPKGENKKPLQYADPLRDLNAKLPWDAEEHQRLARTRLTFAICPTQLPDAGPDKPALTNYVGNGGLGVETAALSLDEAGTKAGVFRYDSATPLEVISDGDGLSNTISLLETAKDLGPWLQGGPATVRSLSADAPPFLGPGAPFSGCHRGRGNFAMADGSVRVITDHANPAFFRALLTIRGGEREAEFDDR